jgi:hypothetical protein
MGEKNEFAYRQFTTKSEAHKAFNSLKGIIEGIGLDYRVNQKEIFELEAWCEKYEALRLRNPFNDIITNIQVIISDNVVTAEEIADMKWLCERFEGEFGYYDVLTSDLQRLQGVCHGLLSDGIIKDEEVKALAIWLDQHSHLSSFYPYDEIVSILTEVLEDNKIDEQERELLAKYFLEFVELTDHELVEEVYVRTKNIDIKGICATAPDIIFSKHQFCWTGTSSRGKKRAEIAKLIEDNGGKFINSVSTKTNYLIVGDDGNPSWAYACYGRKVEKAMQVRKEGGKVVIVHENDFWDAL